VKHRNPVATNLLVLKAEVAFEDMKLAVQLIADRSRPLATAAQELAAGLSARGLEGME
jgi:hypothetical protein